MSYERFLGKNLLANCGSTDSPRARRTKKNKFNRIVINWLSVFTFVMS